MSDLFNPASTKPSRTIHEQIAAVSREIEMREAVYAKQIITGKLSQTKADKQIGDMRAVLATLKWVRDHDEVLREVHRRERDTRETFHTGEIP